MPEVSNLSLLVRIDVHADVKSDLQHQCPFCAVVSAGDLHAHKCMRSQKEQIFPTYLTMQILRHHRDK